MNKTLVLSVIVMFTVIMGVGAIAPSMAAPVKGGIIKDLYPPMNDGSLQGAGMIKEDGSGRELIFKTPKDNNGLPLAVDDRVAFELDERKGKHATNVIVCSLEDTLCPPKVESPLFFYFFISPQT